MENPDYNMGDLWFKSWVLTCFTFSVSHWFCSKSWALWNQPVVFIVRSKMLVNASFNMIINSIKDCISSFRLHCKYVSATHPITLFKKIEMLKKYHIDIIFSLGWPAPLATTRSIWWKMLDQVFELMRMKHLTLRCCEVKCSNHYGAATDGPSSTKASYGRPQQGKA